MQTAPVQTAPAAPSTPPQPSGNRLSLLLHGITGIVESPDHPDLSLRQLAVLGAVATGKSNTVRGLAGHLNVQKPVITRAVDRLEDLGLMRRATDPADRRSVVLSLTSKGGNFLLDLRGSLRGFFLAEG